MRRTPAAKVASLAVPESKLTIEKHLDWLFREQPTEDYGIDAHVEVVDGEMVQGRLLALQIKAESRFRAQGSDGWWYRPERDHVTYWLNLCRSRIRFRLRGLLVLVDQPAQHLLVLYPYRGQIGDRCRQRVSVGWALSTALMWSLAVVVRQVLAEHSEYVLGVVDQDAVQALPPYRAYPALRICVRAGRLERGEKYLDAFGAEYRVEHGRVFGVDLG